MISPLDPFLARFLALVQSKSNGYTPGRQAHSYAEALNVNKAFIDALFVSARTRSLLKPAYRKGGKTHWLVSETGEEFIDRMRPEGGGSQIPVESHSGPGQDSR